MENALEIVAQLMALSARTSPKTAGKDFITLKVISGGQLEELAAAMVAYGIEARKRNFDRDGENVRNSSALLLIGLNAPNTAGLNCGACGNDRCTDLEEAREGPEFKGPFCAWRLVDLGIAMASAAKTASILNADNRIMYRAGVVARRLGYIEGDVVVGIPLSGTGKNIYFDR